MSFLATDSIPAEFDGYVVSLELVAKESLW